MFNGRKLVIATKHAKEKVIAPIMADSFGVNCLVSTDFDSDQFGAFTGEVERKDNAVTTVKKKCQLAMQLSGCDLAIASEGSFGPHPMLFFSPADEEVLLFVDKKNGFEIWTNHLSTETNFSGMEVRTLKELKDFAGATLFPSHGLILRKSKDAFDEMEKGITDWNELSDRSQYFINKYGSVYAETDMRAIYNPTRMKVIEQATQKLVDKIKSLCPQCQCPGFAITEAREGLPCQICDSPTRSAISHIYTCQKCSYSLEKIYPSKKQTEDPRFCDVCNP